MGNKLTPKVILEGTRLTFKTEIAFELNEYPGWWVHTNVTIIRHGSFSSIQSHHDPQVCRLIDAVCSNESGYESPAKFSFSRR
jgi:hypothetical protein